MKTPADARLELPSVRVRWFMGLAWAAILMKCVVVTWAVQHWNMPFDAAWIVAPTLGFALLATGLWVVHTE